MSRIGKQPVAIPKGVSVTISGSDFAVKGPKGELKRRIHPTIDVKQEGEEIIVSPKVDNKYNRKFHGLSRSLIANMVQGVDKGYSKKLTLVGVGYRAAAQGDKLNLTLGYSHPIVYPAPNGIKLSVEKQTTVIVEGNDKEQVGQVAAEIRAFRRPEPYHGKGVRYSDERIITKVGKSGSK